jgi:RNA recognition motif-containing protein
MQQWEVEMAKWIIDSPKDQFVDQIVAKKVDRRPWMKDGLMNIGDFAKKSKDVEMHGKTTVMIRNIPCKYQQDTLFSEIRDMKLLFNFLYLPGARKSLGNLGYAFINFVTPDDAATFIDLMNGHVWQHQATSTKVGAAGYATLQGFDANVSYYSNTKVSKSRKRPFVDYDLAPRPVPIKDQKRLISNHNLPQP